MKPKQLTPASFFVGRKKSLKNWGVLGSTGQAALERYCRRHHQTIAYSLGFSGVRYASGPHFSRKTAKADSGYQMDLVFERDDHVITVCECKYLRGKVSTQVIEEFEKKLQLFPNQNKTIQKVLICTNGAEESLSAKRYFDRILTLDDLVTGSLNT
jgi:hypothetical protein